MEQMLVRRALARSRGLRCEFHLHGMLRNSALVIKAQSKSRTASAGLSERASRNAFAESGHKQCGIGSQHLDAAFGQTRADTLHGHAVTVSGAAGDQQAALFGHACVDPGTGKNTYGTGSFVLINAGFAMPDTVLCFGCRVNAMTRSACQC